MGLTLTKEEVLQTALLARLHLEEHEVEPMTHAVAQAGPLRDDVLGEMLDAETALAGAPRRDGALFVVPKVVEGSG